MSLLSSLMAGQSGMRAANARLAGAAHNVANASTPGFRRRRAVLETGPAIRLGGSVRGTGVTDRGYVRAGSDIVSTRRVKQAGLSSSSAASARTLSTLEVFVGNEGTSGLNTRLDAFWDAATQATGDPSDVSLRRQFAHSGRDFAQSISSATSRLRDGMGAVRDEISGVTRQVSQKLSEVAQLDAYILQQGGRLASGDAADRRDQLVYEVSELIGLDFRIADDESSELYLGGHLLVSDGEARELTFEQDATSGELSVFLSSGKGRLDVTDTVGGQLGGYVDGHRQGQEWVEQLDAITVAFADAVNAQHTAGFDADGNAGTPLFTYDPSDPSGSLGVSEAILADPRRLAFASQASAAAGDAGNLQAMMAGERVELLGGDTIRESLSQWGSRIGASVTSAELMSSQQGAIQEDLEELHASMVGVDLDEEAVSMMEAQTAYQAGAKVIQATDRMFAVLLDLV